MKKYSFIWAQEKILVTIKFINQNYNDEIIMFDNALNIFKCMQYLTEAGNIVTEIIVKKS